MPCWSFIPLSPLLWSLTNVLVSLHCFTSSSASSHSVILGDINIKMDYPLSVLNVTLILELLVPSASFPSTSASKIIVTDWLLHVSAPALKLQILAGDFNTPLSSMGVSSRQKINKETQALNDTLDQMSLIFIEHSIQKQQMTHSSQVHTEIYCMWGFTVCEATRWALVNLRKLKSH